MRFEIALVMRLREFALKHIKLGALENVRKLSVHIGICRFQISVKCRMKGLKQLLQMECQEDGLGD